MLVVWEMDTGNYIIVNLDKYGWPIGPEETTLTRFIGSLVRMKQYASIKYKSWKYMSDKEKDEVLAQIEVLYIQLKIVMNQKNVSLMLYLLNISLFV